MHLDLNHAYFRLRRRKNQRSDSHGRRLRQSVTRGPFRFYGESGLIQGETNTRGHGSFRRLLSSIISPARGRPRVVNPRGASSSSTLTPLAPARGSVVVRFLSPSSFRIYLIPRSPVPLLLSNSYTVSNTHFDGSVSGSFAFL